MLFRTLYIKNSDIWHIFLLQLKTPIVYLLLAAAAVSMYFRDFIETAAILVVILINAIIGFFMELQARSSMNALKEMDYGFNNNARDRAIVMHTAAYADTAVIKELGRLGRSLGCPTLPQNTFDKIANQLSNSAIIFHYYPDANYLNKSVWLH